MFNTLRECVPAYGNLVRKIPGDSPFLFLNSKIRMLLRDVRVRVTPPWTRLRCF
jgi:hypothetical protein